MGYLNLIAGGVQAYQQIQQGSINAANARLEASRDERDALSAQAESQQQALNERRRAKFLRSRALAVAGASGAGISEDPTVGNILSDIETEGEYRALSALYEGDSLAEGLRSGSQSKRRMAKAYEISAGANAAGTLAGGAYSFYSRYG